MWSGSKSKSKYVHPHYIQVEKGLEIREHRVFPSGDLQGNKIVSDIFNWLRGRCILYASSMKPKILWNLTNESYSSLSKWYPMPSDKFERSNFLWL